MISEINSCLCIRLIDFQFNIQKEKLNPLILQVFKCSGIVSVFAYGISFLFLDKGIGKLKMVFVVTFLMSVLNIIFLAFEKPQYTMQNYLISAQKGNIAILAGIWGIYGLAAIIMIKKGIKKYEM